MNKKTDRQKNKIILKNVNFSYGSKKVIKDLNAVFLEKRITAITGPSGQGKSTLLTLFNCMWKDIPKTEFSGDIKIKLNNKWISPNKHEIALPLLRQKVGMIFQEPNPLPASIAKNMAFPLKIANIKNKDLIREKTEKALKQAFLWNEVKDRLHESALNLSGGQKQRLCIARALVLEPEVLLCDEPTSSLDSKACGVIEDLMISLKNQCTLLVVSHYMDQVERIGDQIMELTEKGMIYL